MKDLIYYYDKETLTKHELGEIQTNFNMSLVIDGTKDSLKVVVHNFSGAEITPNTIIKHQATNTWWIVSHDKVSRYPNEKTNNSVVNYVDYPMYMHELQLEGAIELLNARDFTDSGFNSNRYSVGDFIKRLFALSNFEFNKTIWNETSNFNLTIQTNSNIDLDKNVDYVKTFENYTLLSALREFLDGYNFCAKLSFNESANQITSATLSIISKTGNVNVPAINGDDLFKDPRETKNMDKSSYGTSVISNAENVISTKTKTYPSVGAVKLSSNKNTIDGTNALLRLPSNAFKVNYIDLYPTNVPYGYFNGTTHDIGYYDSSDIKSCQIAYNNVISYMEQQGVSQTIIDDFSNSVKVEDFQKVKRRLYYVDNYNPTTKTFISENIINELWTNNTFVPLVLTNNELAPTIDNTKGGIYFTRGKDIIENFTMFEKDSDKRADIRYANSSDILLYDRGLNDIKVYTGVVGQNTGYPSTFQSWKISEVAFSVNYVPMTDVKIKIDNDGITHDSNLYNQNGKLNDSNALSKMLLSYAKEIESDSITKYGTFYASYKSTNGFQSNLPSVGDLIKLGNEYYVINNISLDFTPNENTSENDSLGYYITAEVSLSKRIAVKSMLTSPNTNIRDYGIPQNNNVKRKQVYRDFYEFTYTRESESHNWYMPLGKVLDLLNTPSKYKEHIGIIKTTFYSEMNGDTEYYYQLETTTYKLKKSMYEILDFKDNNIIGYGSQNLWSGFDITKIFVGNNTFYNTPISYVDDKGELSKLDILFATIDKVQQAYETYAVGVYNLDHNKDYRGVSLYNANVFIPMDIYILLNIGLYDFKITEDNYKKDALEVPVFEYSCQVDDTLYISVGENILDSGDDDVAYLYQFALVDDITQFTDNNFSLNSFPNVNVSSNIATYSNVAKFDTTHINDNEPYFTIKLYESDTYNVDSESSSLGNQVSFPQSLQGKQLIIARNTLTKDNIVYNLVGELISNTIYSSVPTPSIGYKGKYYVDSSGNYFLCEPEQYSLAITTNDYVQNLRIRITRDNIITQHVFGASANYTLDIYTGDYIEWETTPINGFYIDGDTSGSWQQGDGNQSISVVAKTISFNITCDSHTSVSGSYYSTITGQTYTFSVASGETYLLICGYGGSYSFDVSVENANYTLDSGEQHYEQSNVITDPSDISLSASIHYVSLSVNMSGSNPFTLSGSIVDKVGNTTEITYAYQGLSSHTETYQVVKGGSFKIDFQYDKNTYYTSNVSHVENSEMTANQSVSFSITQYCFIYLTFNTGVSSITLTLGNNEETYYASDGNRTIKALQGVAYSWSSNISNSYQYEFDGNTTETMPTGSGTTSASSVQIRPTTSVKTYRLLGTSTNGSVAFYDGDDPSPIGITPVAYGTTIFAVITPNSGYNPPSDTTIINGKGYIYDLVVDENMFSLSGSNATKTFSPCTIKKFDMTWNMDSGIQGIAYNHNNNGYINVNRAGRTSITLNLAYGTIVWYAYPNADYNIEYPLTPIQSQPETITFNQDTTRNATSIMKKPVLTLSGSIGSNRPKVNVENILSQAITITSVIYAPSGIGQSTTIFSGSQSIASGSNADFTGRLFGSTIQSGDSIFVSYTYKNENYTISKDY